MNFDVREYLGSVLPALIRSRDAAGPLPEATIQFFVAGVEGADCAYVMSPESGLEVRTGVSDTQDLALTFKRVEDLPRFFRNELDVEAALKSQRLRVHGNTDLLAWLAKHLAA